MRLPDKDLTIGNLLRSNMSLITRKLKQVHNEDSEEFSNTFLKYIKQLDYFKKLADSQSSILRIKYMDAFVPNLDDWTNVITDKSELNKIISDKLQEIYLEDETITSKISEFDEEKAARFKGFLQANREKIVKQKIKDLDRSIGDFLNDQDQHRERIETLNIEMQSLDAIIDNLSSNIRTKIEEKEKLEKSGQLLPIDSIVNQFKLIEQRTGIRFIGSFDTSIVFVTPNIVITENNSSAGTHNEREFGSFMGFFEPFSRKLPQLKRLKNGLLLEGSFTHPFNNEDSQPFCFGSGGNKAKQFNEGGQFINLFSMMKQLLVEYRAQGPWRALSDFKSGHKEDEYDFIFRKLRSAFHLFSATREAGFRSFNQQPNHREDTINRLRKLRGTYSFLWSILNEDYSFDFSKLESNINSNMIADTSEQNYRAANVFFIGEFIKTFDGITPRQLMEQGIIKEFKEDNNLNTPLFISVVTWGGEDIKEEINKLGYIFSRGGPTLLNPVSCYTYLAFELRLGQAGENIIIKLMFEGNQRSTLFDNLADLISTDFNGKRKLSDMAANTTGVPIASNLRYLNHPLSKLTGYVNIDYDEAIRYALRLILIMFKADSIENIDLLGGTNEKIFGLKFRQVIQLLQTTEDEIKNLDLNQLKENLNANNQLPEQNELIIEDTADDIDIWIEDEERCDECGYLFDECECDN